MDSGGSSSLSGESRHNHGAGSTYLRQRAPRSGCSSEYLEWNRYYFLEMLRLVIANKVWIQTGCVAKARHFGIKAIK